MKKNNKQRLAKLEEKFMAKKKTSKNGSDAQQSQPNKTRSA